MAEKISRKVIGIPPKAGRCYDVGNEELEK